MDSYDWIRNLLKGCGRETDIAELIGLVGSVIEEYGYGRISKEELSGVCIELCKSITTIAKDCGRAVDMDTCVKTLSEKIEHDAYAGTLSLRARSIREMLMQRRRGRRESGGTGGVSVIP